MHPLVLWEDPADDERSMALGRAFRDDLRAVRDRRRVPQLHRRRGRASACARRSGASDERLAHVKATWDPHNVFSGNQSLQPIVPAA